MEYAMQSTSFYFSVSNMIEANVCQIECFAQIPCSPTIYSSWKFSFKKNDRYLALYLKMLKLARNIDIMVIFPQLYFWHCIRWPGERVSVLWHEQGSQSTSACVIFQIFHELIFKTIFIYSMCTQPWCCYYHKDM